MQRASLGSSGMQLMSVASDVYRAQDQGDGNCTDAHVVDADGKVLP